MSKHRAESMDVRMWRGQSASNLLDSPPWMSLMVRRVFNRGAAPRLAYLKPKDPHTFGGRYFPDEHAIGVFHYPDDEVVKVVLLHELAHALLGVHGHDGAHDEHWAKIAHRLYERFGASAGAVALVDGGGE